MRKYREYSDSELREKFPEVDDYKYPRIKFVCALNLGNIVKSKTTGETFRTIEEVDEWRKRSKLTSKTGIDKDGWRKE